MNYSAGTGITVTNDFFSEHDKWNLTLVTSEDQNNKLV